jgi:hypothetical protein
MVTESQMATESRGGTADAKFAEMLDSAVGQFYYWPGIDGHPEYKVIMGRILEILEAHRLKTHNWESLKLAVAALKREVDRVCIETSARSLLSVETASSDQ